MPQDTTIYWNGKGQLPALIDSLPLEEQQVVLNAIHQKIRDGIEPAPLSPFLFFGAIIIIISFLVIYSNNKNRKKEDENTAVFDTDPCLPEEPTSNPVLTYPGNKLDFTLPVLLGILKKHSVYFSALNPFEKDKFIERLRKFIAAITFVIHDKSGFKEMPVLISAAAIQLTFGLEKYLLPDFDYIHIFPEEFIGVHPSIRVLEGNVSGNTINLSWKHFLEGFQYPNDGQNVGLHEMAHAYYYQFFETSRYQSDSSFVTGFPAFNNYGNKVFEQEAKPGFDLYSDYALRNFQEFWAESIEIFFERPAVMKAQYPDLYSSVCTLLNQYPV